MNKIDKILESAKKFEKIAKNLKLAQDYNPLSLQEVQKQIQAIKSSVASKIGSNLVDTEMQESFSKFVNNRNPRMDGSLLTGIMNFLRSKPQFKQLFNSLLSESVDLENLSIKYNNLATKQIPPEIPTINIENPPNAPDSKPNTTPQSFVQKVDQKVAQLGGVTRNLLSLVAIPGPDSKEKAPLEVEKIDRLVVSLAKDKQLLNKGQEVKGTGMSQNSGFLSGLSGEVVDSTIAKINNSFLKAVDAKTQAIAAALAGPTGVDIKSLLN